jgi:hypothetical protein
VLYILLYWNRYRIYRFGIFFRNIIYIFLQHYLFARRSMKFIMLHLYKSMNVWNIIFVEYNFIILMIQKYSACQIMAHFTLSTLNSWDNSSLIFKSKQGLLFNKLEFFLWNSIFLSNPPMRWAANQVDFRHLLVLNCVNVISEVCSMRKKIHFDHLPSQPSLINFIFFLHVCWKKKEICILHFSIILSQNYL